MLRRRRSSGYKPARRIQRAWRRRRGGVNARQNRAISTLFKRTRKERKYIDQTANTSIGTIWSTLLPRPLTYVVQGDNNDQRIGNKLTVHSMHLKGFVTVDDTTNLLRIIVVKFGRMDNSQIAVQEFLSNSNAASPQHLLSFKHRNSKLKYQFLADRTYVLAGNDTAGSSSGPYSVKKLNINMKLNSSIFFNADTDTVPVTGYTYVIAASDSLLGGCMVNLASRVIFSG